MGAAPGETGARFRLGVSHERVFVRVEIVVAAAAARPKVLENVVRAAEMQTGMLTAAPLKEAVVLRAGMNYDRRVARRVRCKVLHLIALCKFCVCNEKQKKCINNSNVII